MNNKLKSGFLTSEFWITLGAIGGVLWAFLKDNCDVDSSKLVGLIISLGIAAGIYTGSRTMVKKS